MQGGMGNGIGQRYGQNGYGAMTPGMMMAQRYGQNGYAPGGSMAGQQPRTGGVSYQPPPPPPTLDVAGPTRLAVDPYQDYSPPPPTMEPRMGRPPGSDDLTGFGRPQQPPTMAPQGGVMGADGQRYADRNSSPRAYTGGAFNPAANQWGDYSQRQGSGLFGTDAQGINRFNGNVFAPSGLNSGNNDFANFLERFAPQFQRQNGPINMGRAQTWGAPQGVLQGSPRGAGGINRGNGPQFDPRTNPGNQFNRGGGPQFDPRMFGRNPYFQR